MLKIFSPEGAAAQKRPIYLFSQLAGARSPVKDVALE